MEAIDHLDLVVSDLERSLAFYTELLSPLGYVNQSPIEGERGEHVVYVGRPGGFGSVSLRAKQSDAHEVPYDALRDRHPPHLLLGGQPRDGRPLRAWLRDNGHTIESGPEEYGYTPGYYAVFFYDPDGIKLEILHRPRERDLARRVMDLETDRGARGAAARRS